LLEKIKTIEKRVKNGSLTFEKRIRRKGRRNLSKLQNKKKKERKKKKTWIFESQNPTLGGKKKQREGEKRNKDRR